MTRPGFAFYRTGDPADPPIHPVIGGRQPGGLGILGWTAEIELPCG